MIQLNRETVTLAGVLIALAGCVYLYKELQKVQRQIEEAPSFLPQPASPPVTIQAPVNDIKVKPVVAAAIVSEKKED